MNVKNGLKKTLASFLVAVLLLTAAPLAGVADLDLSGVADWFSTTAKAAETYTEGYLEYEVSNGKATITDCDESSSGELVIPDTLGGYPVTSIGNWAFKGCTSLTGVAIPDSVTSIGERAFSGCVGLTSITIGNSVTSIGNWAFYGCTSFTSITISDSVTSIGDDAFHNCIGLTSITIPDNVTSIGSSAFSGCTGLTSVTIGNSVTSIGSCAFIGCAGLTSITIPDNVTSIGSYAFSGCTGLTSITIPDNVTSIGGHAFSGTAYYNKSDNWKNGALYIGNYLIESKTSLSGVYKIKDGTKTIANGAFSGCIGLTSVTIPDSVTRIYPYAFEDCTGLTSITIGNSVTSIGDCAFYGCTSLTSVTIPDSVTSIGDCAFYDCTGLARVTIGNSVISIGSSSFAGCTGLTSITIPNSVTSIGDCAFGSCTGLTKINWNAESVSNFGTYNYVFSNAGTESEGIDVVFGDNVKSIPAYLFYSSFFYIYDYETPNIKSVTIGNSVTSIGRWAFSECTELKSITIGNSVTSIGEMAFNGCTGLTKINWNAESVSGFGEYSFSNAGTAGEGIDVVFGDNVKSIPAYLFYGSNSNYKTPNIKSVTIGNSVTSIGDCVFRDCTGLTKINWNAENVSDFDKYNYIFSNAGIEGEGIDVVFGDNVKSIPSYLFYSYETSYETPNIKSVTIGNSVTSIGERSFYNCTGLTSITILDSVTSIGSSAFAGCTGLTSVTIGNSVTSIGKGAFSGCTGLTSITIPNSVTSIGSSAFYNCTGLTSVTIPNSITSIGDHTFYGCTGLTSITISDSVTSIGNWAFEYCTGLTSVTIGNGVTSIGNWAFGDCTGLAKINWNAENVSNFSNYNNIFSNAGTAGEGIDVVFGDNVKSIPAYLFYSSSNYYKTPNIKSVTIGNSVTSIGSCAFKGCTGLTSITIPDSVTRIGSSAFGGCTGLTDICYSGTSEEWKRIETAFPSEVLKNATVHCTGDPSDPSGGTDPKDDTYDNYDDKEEIEKELSNYSVIIGKIDSYVLGVVLNSGSSYVSEVTVDKTEYPVSEKVLSESTAKSLENKNVFIAVKDGKVEWIDKMDSYVGEPYVEIDSPKYSYSEKNGLNCTSVKKDITVKISYPFKNATMAPAPGTATSIFDTNAFYETLSHEFLKCDLYDLSLSEVKITSGDPNLKLPVGNILTSTDKKTLKVCESIEYEISTEVSPSLTVGSDKANKELSFYVEAKTSKGTLSKRGNVVVSNPLYRSNNHPWDNKPSSGGDSQSDSDAQAKKAARILNNIPISLNGDISGSLYKLFTEEQLEAIAAVIYTEVAMYKAPKDSFKDTLSTKIIEKVFKCKTNILSFNQNEIALTFAVDTQWGEIKVEFTTKSNNFGLDGSDYAFFGNIYYEIVGGKAKNKLPKSISKSGFAGGLSGVDMEAFCKAVWSVAQGQLKSAYNKAYGDDLNKAANIIFGESVNKVLKHSKYGSVSGLVWKLLVTPSTTVKIECPVDVLIYDSDNKLVASFINDEMTSKSENVCLSIVDGAKTVQLFDDSYHIEYLPFAEGKMNITTEEYGFSGDLLNRTLIKDVPLNVGITYKQQIDNSYVEGSDYSLTSSKGEKYDADEYTTVFHTHVSDGTIYHSDASTCTVRGAEYKYCVICNDYYCELLPLADHTDSNNDGKCDTCGESLGTTPEEPENPSASCSCACHKKGIVKFFFKIGLFFQKIFKKNKICKCGAQHY